MVTVIFEGINDAAEEMGVDVDVKYYYGGQFYGSDAITARMEAGIGMAHRLYSHAAAVSTHLLLRLQSSTTAR